MVALRKIALGIRAGIETTEAEPRRGARPYGLPAARRCEVYGLVNDVLRNERCSRQTVGSIETAGVDQSQVER